MKKLKLVGMLAAVVMLMFIVVASYLSEKNVDEPEELFVVPVTRDELFISSEEGYNSIEIYKQENKLVINAQSEAAFFDGVQFTVEIEGEIAQEDVEIIWMTIGGNTEYVEGNDRIIAEIKISDNDELIATVYKGNIIKNLIMDCQSYTKYRPNETTGGIFVSWRRKEELPTGA